MGDDRAVQAAEKAIANPLLDEISLKGAKGVLINITGAHDLTLFELDEAANRIRDAIDRVAVLIEGVTAATRYGALATLVTGFLVLIGAAAAGERSTRRAWSTRPGCGWRKKPAPGTKTGSIFWPFAPSPCGRS